MKTKIYKFIIIFLGVISFLFMKPEMNSKVSFFESFAFSKEYSGAKWVEHYNETRRKSEYDFNSDTRLTVLGAYALNILAPGTGHLLLGEFFPMGIIYTASVGGGLGLIYTLDPETNASTIQAAALVVVIAWVTAVLDTRYVVDKYLWEKRSDYEHYGNKKTNKKTFYVNLQENPISKNVPVLISQNKDTKIKAGYSIIF